MSEVKDKLITAENLKNAYDDNKRAISDLKGDLVNIHDDINYMTFKADFNMLPVANMVHNTYESNGLTIKVLRNGCISIQGTSLGGSVDILPERQPFANLIAQKNYRMRSKLVSGTAGGKVQLFIGTSQSGYKYFHSTSMASEYKTVTPLADETLTRMLIETEAGSYDCVVSLYLQTEEKYDKDYDGIEEYLNKDIIKSEYETVISSGVSDMISEVQKMEADIRFAVFSDTHLFDERKYDKYKMMMDTGIFDALIGLGDYQEYKNDETIHNSLHRISKLLSKSGRDRRCLYTIGNHDAAVDASTFNSYDNFKGFLTKKQLYDEMIRHLDIVAIFDSKNPYGGYYYVDFAPQKIRVIVLNTSDVCKDGGGFYATDGCVLVQQAQVDWIQNVALNFADKADSEEWGVVACAHVLTAPSNNPYVKLFTAANNAKSISETWSIPMKTGYSEQYTYTINADFTSHRIPVYCVLIGHDHIEMIKTYGGVPYIRFGCDNMNIADYYSAHVNGLSGKYRFEIDGRKYSFTADDSTAVIVKVNKYGLKSTINVHTFDAEYNISQLTAQETTDTDGTLLELTQDRFSDTISAETSYAVSINKDTNKIDIVTLGYGWRKTIDI